MTLAESIEQVPASYGLVKKGISIGTIELAKIYHQQLYAIIPLKLLSWQRCVAIIDNSTI